MTQGPLEPESLALQRIRLGLTGTAAPPTPPPPPLAPELLLLPLLDRGADGIDEGLALEQEEEEDEGEDCWGDGLVSRDLLMKPGRGRRFRPLPLPTTSGVVVVVGLGLRPIPDGIREDSGSGGVDSLVELNLGLADRSRNEMLPPPEGVDDVSFDLG